MGYYKVMRYSAPPPGKLISLIPRNRLWVTEYKFLEWAYPKHEGSKLAVFEAIEPAKSFMIIYQAFNPLVVMRLWQVEVEGDPLRLEYVPILHYAFWEFWKDPANYRVKHPNVNYKDCPPGTLWVDGVRLIKPVKP